MKLKVIFSSTSSEVKVHKSNNEHDHMEKSPNMPLTAAHKKIIDEGLVHKKTLKEIIPDIRVNLVIFFKKPNFHRKLVCLFWMLQFLKITSKESDQRVSQKLVLLQLMIAENMLRKNTVLRVTIKRW